MNKIEVKEVTSKQDLKRFVNFQYDLYRGNPYFVPPLRFDEVATLDKKKNPSFDYCEARYWLAYQNEKIVGRVAAIINHSFISKWGKRYLRFGWIDFIDDENVSRALMEKVEQVGKENLAKAIHGPLGFTDMDHEGMLIEGFDQLGTLATIYNFPYYKTHLEKLGYQKDTDWVEYLINVPDRVPEKIERLATIVEKKFDLHFLNAKNRKELLPYTNEVFELLNVAYKDLYGVVELTKRQIEYYVKQYFGFVRADYISIILDKDNSFVAFGITLPSLSKALQKSNGKLFPFGFIHLLRAMKKNDLADMYLVAIRPDMQDKGVNAMLMNHITKVYIKNKILRAESNPELEDNVKVQAIWKYFDARQHKRRRCFIKHIGV